MSNKSIELKKSELGWYLDMPSGNEIMLGDQVGEFIKNQESQISELEEKLYPIREYNDYAKKRITALVGENSRLQKSLNDAREENLKNRMEKLGEIDKENF